MNIEYNKLIDEIRLTGNYIDQLVRIETQMRTSVDDDELDIEVRKALSNCIDEINKMYINSATLETRLEAIDEEHKAIYNKGTLKEEL